MGTTCSNKWAGTLAAWALPAFGHASPGHSQALRKSPHSRWLGCTAADFDCAISAFSSGDPLERARSVPNPAQTRCPPAHPRSGALRRPVCVDGRQAYTSRRRRVEICGLRGLNYGGSDTIRNTMAMGRTVHWCYVHGLLGLEKGGTFLFALSMTADRRQVQRSARNISQRSQFAT